MHYIYSQSLIVRAILQSWSSLLEQNPRPSSISCSDLLINARQACTDKGIPLPAFGSDTRGELDEITLCSSELIAAHMVGVKLNTIYESINNSDALPLELDKPGLEIISDSLRLLRRDLEGLRSHFLCSMWLNQDLLRPAYSHVDIMVRMMDLALHGSNDDSIIVRYQELHRHDHLGYKGVLADDELGHNYQDNDPANFVPVVEPIEFTWLELIQHKIVRSWPFSLVLSAQVILGLFLLLWGLVATMSTKELSSLGTITQATIVSIEDQYIHKKESRNLERVEHHFQELIEFTLPDGTNFKTPLYLDGRLDGTKTRPQGTKIKVLYKNDEPHIVIDAHSITPLYQGVAALGGGLLLIVVGLWMLVVLYVRQYSLHKVMSIASLAIAALAIIPSSIWLFNYFNKSFIWLYDAISYDDLHYDHIHDRFVLNKDQEPYTGLVRSFKDGIYTLSNFEQGRKEGIEYIYVAATPMGYYHYRAGKLDGPYQSVDSFGHIESQGYYRGGHLDGRWIKYDAVKGAIAASGNWCWGAKDGTWSFYRADGTLYCREHYAQDLLNGEYKEFNPLGQLILQTSYVKDIAHGTITRYWPNGNKLYEAQLESGIVHGDFNAYYANGTPFVFGTMSYGRWHEPPKVYNHQGEELDVVQKRLYRKSKDKQICTVKRAIALDYNLSFDEVGSALSMYKFRIGSEAYSSFDYDLALIYSDEQRNNNFSYFTLPDEKEQAVLDELSKKQVRSVIDDPFASDNLEGELLGNDPKQNPYDSDLVKLGNQPSLSQSQALTPGRVSTNKELSIRERSQLISNRPLNNGLDVDKIAQDWAHSNLAQFNHQDDLPALAEVNPSAITWPNEALNLPPTNRPKNADTRNNSYVPFDRAIKGLLLIALHNWVGEEVVGIPGVDAPRRSKLQYGDGVYSDTSFAWLRYPDNFILTVSVTRPYLQTNPVLVRGFENSLLRFDPYNLVYMTKKNFMQNHTYVPPYVISITYQYSPTDK